MNSSTATATGTAGRAEQRSTLSLRPDAVHTDARRSRVSHRADHEPGKVTFRNRAAAAQSIQYQHAAR